MHPIDIIGDIHGHADELEALLKKMGYSKSAGVYTHPERKALFVGDYIDRGPKIEQTLELVRGMVEHGSSIALMGNHEYNALCFHFEEREGGHLRKHSIKNILQHFKTLEQFKGMQEKYNDYMDWFLTLPLYYEDENLRAVHACWDEEHISLLKDVLLDSCLTPDLVHETVVKGSALYEAVEATLKGKEIALPKRTSFNDKDGNLRSHMRIKWWLEPNNLTYKDASIHPNDGLPDTKIDASELRNTSYYPAEEKPVFFGHYWLKGEPALQSSNVCCLDYSVAKEGALVAYRFGGEQQLTNENFISF